jgi:hypothetical protein
MLEVECHLDLRSWMTLNEDNQGRENSMAICGETLTDAYCHYGNY